MCIVCVRAPTGLHVSPPTHPRRRRICTAPDVCTCKPGYTGNDCERPMCVQSCGQHGLCNQPDTCTCDFGWFDANCTTPVCVQTCGNGGNCTAPDVCNCPSTWQGASCREPVCTQECENGGLCVAPDTCRCLPQWSGYDCSKPVCQQGFFRADPVANEAPPETLRPVEFRLYSPCNVSAWCDSTQGFDCRQLQRSYINQQVPPWRDVTGGWVARGGGMHTGPAVRCGGAVAVRLCSACCAPA